LAHASSSLQGLALAVVVQPMAGSQLSSVQMFPSSQEVASVARQAPSLHVEALVQALPSSQSIVTLPEQNPSMQTSPTVQLFPSSQLMGVPKQAPASQWSPMVQASPSRH
jgi:hypothetical protein